MRILSLSKKIQLQLGFFDRLSPVSFGAGGQYIDCMHSAFSREFTVIKQATRFHGPCIHRYPVDSISRHFTGKQIQLLPGVQFITLNAHILRSLIGNISTRCSKSRIPITVHKQCMPQRSFGRYRQSQLQFNHGGNHQQNRNTNKFFPLHIFKSCQTRQIYCLLQKHFSLSNRISDSNAHNILHQRLF